MLIILSCWWIHKLTLATQIISGVGPTRGKLRPLALDCYRRIRSTRYGSFFYHNINLKINITFPVRAEGILKDIHF
jgi:hypothetical protein